MTVNTTTNPVTSEIENPSIAISLEGTWSGTMNVYTNYNDHDYHVISTDIEFIGDPIHATKGTGCWVDYYSGALWDYIANHIEWKVNNHNIEVYFVEENTWKIILDYALTDNYFTGKISVGDNKIEFRMRHIPSPNWDSFRYGYNY